LRRTHETARAIVRAGLPGPDPIPGPDAPAIADLAEQSFGEWQGLTYEELRHSRGGAFHRFWHAPAHERAPGGESFLDVMRRVARHHGQPSAALIPRPQKNPAGFVVFLPSCCLR